MLSSLILIFFKVNIYKSFNSHFKKNNPAKPLLSTKEWKQLTLIRKCPRAPTPSTLNDILTKSEG